MDMHRLRCQQAIKGEMGRIYHIFDVDRLGCPMPWSRKTPFNCRCRALVLGVLVYSAPMQELACRSIFYLKKEDVTKNRRALTVMIKGEI